MKIICIGNRFIHPDGAALWLYDTAQQQTWAAGIHWIEGGLGGLNLLPHFETRQSIILLDYMPQHANASMTPVHQLLNKQIQQYDHSTALYYLLHCLPLVYSSVPDIQCLSCRPDTPHWQTHVFNRIQHHIKQYEEVA